MKFYIIKYDNNFNEYKHYVEPMKAELKDAQFAARLGMQKGMVSLPEGYLRTSTVYWEL